jgi:hypothetical protein
MKRIALTLAAVLLSFSCSSGNPPATTGRDAAPPASIPWPAGLPVYGHIVIVVEENKDYDEVIGSTAAPYINDVLKAEGANLTLMYGEEHLSQGNYFWLFSGSDQNVGFEDQPPTQPLTASNLGQQLIAAGLTFKGYAEDLPSIGFTGDFSPNGLYARKHVPWISFSNVPNCQTIDCSSNLRFEDFPTDYNDLPTVSFVIPNLDHDMHNGAPPSSVTAGDTWIKENLNGYYQWAKQNNSLLILTFDEDDQADVDGLGLTNPGAGQNRIVTILAGARIKPGDYSEGNGVTHVNLLRTLEAMYGLPQSGAQQPNALAAGISDSYILTDIFMP